MSWRHAAARQIVCGTFRNEFVVRQCLGVRRFRIGSEIRKTESHRMKRQTSLSLATAHGRHNGSVCRTSAASEHKWEHVAGAKRHSGFFVRQRNKFISLHLPPRIPRSI